MKIILKDKYQHDYEALIVEFQALQDFEFKVSYYDDEGQYYTEIVTHHRIILDNEVRDKLEYILSGQ